MISLLSSLTVHLRAILASKAFFFWTLGLFGLCASWVALSSLFPMAFDEDFHVGIIKIYSHYGSIMKLRHTPDMARFGAVPVDPSYLFHYLMSIPWWICTSLLHLSETTTIIVLRLIDVVLFESALVVSWLLLRRLGVAMLYRNFILAMTCLLPISPLIAGQVNYDNLFFLLVACSLLLGVGVVRSIQRAELSIGQCVGLIVVLLMGTATKYAFLPIAVAMCAVVIVIFVRARQRRTLMRHVARSIATTRFIVIIGYILIIGAAVTINVRYITNLATYHSLSPSCDKVFEKNDCLNYSVYARDEAHRQLRDKAFTPLDPVSYTIVYWIPGIIYRLFFTLSGATTGYDTYNPAVVPIIVYCVFAVGAFVYLLRTIPSFIKNRPIEFWLIIVVFLAYIGALIVQLYGSYRSTAQPVALNGRYLVPFFPLIGWIAFEIVRQRSRTSSKLLAQLRFYAPLLCSVCLLLVFVTGGGLGTYLAAGKAEWFWPGFGRSSFELVHPVVAWIVRLYPRADV